MSDDLQARCEANEALQMQREKKIDIMVDEMVKRLNREKVTDEDTYESIVHDLEKKMKAEFDIMQVELDGDALEGDMQAFLVEWDQAEDLQEYTQLEYAIGYDEETSTWHQEANGWNS